jgi:hypothetical protein
MTKTIVARRTVNADPIFIGGIISVGLLAAVVLGLIIHVVVLRNICGIAFGLFALGASGCSFKAPGTWLEYLLASTCGSLVLLVLLGFVNVELGIGHLLGLCEVVSVLVGAVHLAGVYRYRARAGPLFSRMVGLVRRRSSLARLGISGLALLPSALAIAGAKLSAPASPSLLGYLSVTNVVWVAGAVLAVVSIIVWHSRPWQLLALPVNLYCVVILAPAISYPVTRYAYSAKHVGVVEYILRNHAVNPRIDIYQAWPGFFSAIAWLVTGAGISDPLSLARWWPPIIDALTLLAMAALAKRVLTSQLAATFAVSLFLLANAIGQDYFSPQSLAFFFAVVVYYLIIRPAGVWAHRTNYALLLPLSIALAVSHQITSYLAAVVAAVLFAFGLASSWLPILALAGPAAAWALRNLQVVRKYFSLSTVGNITSNVRTQTSHGLITHKDAVQLVAQYSLALGIFVVGAVALLGLAQRRDRLQWALCVCALSSSVLLFATNYGGEGIFRVGLFAVPWLSVAAARADLSRRMPLHATHGRRGLGRELVRTGIVAVLLCTYVCSDLMLDSIQAVSPGEVTSERIFEATPGSGNVLVFMGAYEGPKLLTANYPRYRNFLTFPFIVQLPYRRFGAYTRYELAKIHPRKVYLEFTSAAEYFGELNGFYSPKEYQAYRQDVAKDPAWSLVYHKGTTFLYEN